jgi:MFS family permease
MAAPEHPSAWSPAWRLFWAAQAISRLGDPITLIAFAAAVFSATGSALLTSAAVLVATAPQATVGFFSGAIADALGHRRAMVLSDVGRAVCVGLIPTTLALPVYSIPSTFALALIAGLFGSVFHPARIAIIPSLVPAARLVSANSLVHTTDRVVEIAGAASAGILVAQIGNSAFYVDAATFAASAVLLSRVPVSARPPQQLSIRSLWGDAVAGLSFIRDTRELLANTVTSLVAQLSLPVLNALLPVMLFRKFASFDFRIGAQQYGIAEAALATGAVAMGLAIVRHIGRMRKGRVLIAGWAAYGALLVALALAPTFEIVVCILVVTGAANVLFFVPNVTISQELTPTVMRARVFGARISLVSFSWLPITLGAGALAEVIDASLIIGAAGAFTFTVALIATRIRAVADVP